MKIGDVASKYWNEIPCKFRAKGYISNVVYYKFHKYILVWNEVETSGLAANSYKKYIDIGYNRIITHLTEIM